MKIDDTIPSQNENDVGRRRSSFMRIAPVITRFLLGGVLLLAAILKAHDLLSAISANTPNANLFARLQPGAIIVETILGSWLIIGWRWPIARVVAAAWMLALCGVSFYEALSGAASCGCFGTLQINPWIIFSLDIAALTALGLTPSRACESLAPTRRISLAISQITLVAILLIALSNALRKPFTPSPAAVQAQSDTWRQSSVWPLGKYIDVWDDISHGKWVVLIYNSRCRPCIATRDDYEALAKQWKSQNNPIQIALLDIAGKGADPAEGTDPNSAALYGQLNLPENSNFDITPPSLVLLNDGKVIQLSEGYDDSQWNDRVFPQ